MTMTTLACGSPTMVPAVPDRIDVPGPGVGGLATDARRHELASGEFVDHLKLRQRRTGKRGERHQEQAYARPDPEQARGRTRGSSLAPRDGATHERFTRQAPGERTNATRQAARAEGRAMRSKAGTMTMITTAGS